MHLSASRNFCSVLSRTFSLTYEYFCKKWCNKCKNDGEKNDPLDIAPARFYSLQYPMNRVIPLKFIITPQFKKFFFALFFINSAMIYEYPPNLSGVIIWMEFSLRSFKLLKMLHKHGNLIKLKPMNSRGFGIFIEFHWKFFIGVALVNITKKKLKTFYCYGEH